MYNEDICKSHFYAQIYQIQRSHGLIRRYIGCFLDVDIWLIFNIIDRLESKF